MTQHRKQIEVPYQEHVSTEYVRNIKLPLFLHVNPKRRHYFPHLQRKLRLRGGAEFPEATQLLGEEEPVHRPQGLL